MFNLKRFTFRKTRTLQFCTHTKILANLKGDEFSDGKSSSAPDVSTRAISFLRAEHLSDKKPTGLMGRHRGCSAAWQGRTGAVRV